MGRGFGSGDVSGRGSHVLCAHVEWGGGIFFFYARSRDVSGRGFPESRLIVGGAKSCGNTIHYVTIPAAASQLPHMTGGSEETLAGPCHLPSCAADVLGSVQDRLGFVVPC